MPMYIARTIEDKQLVGVFSATSTPQLFDVVDEMVDPFVCEFLRLPNGSGLFLDGSVKPDETYEVEDDSDEPLIEVTVVPGNFTGTSEVLCEAVQTQKPWKQFTRKDLAAAYGLSEKALDGAANRQELSSALGIAVPAE